ncbi:conjugative transposon protein TraM [Bacteroides vulgatus]|uniref:conjugative transposon protein TraM n=1 Tax=Bacteroidaceae TaxID=815 RepID=UPI00059B411B|nr:MULTISPECIES: conjugative transposon protein TraM [Bacteroidaceae]NMW51560.1 conjugative transposon protein TraM [Phocaeicola vulgatus]PQL56519.1 conjugative transposon protein TraM [Phocaeicola vulgatus]QQY40451.1 conjugative transposon protein TraM [Phocaeicola vulgatus]QRN02270.1 conjugative transposon protein TraM [Bacteroides xylanisolvens]
MSKINFKQPKYIFPLVVFIPLCALVYFVMQTFGGSEDAQQTVATDRINTELPQANAEEAGDKMYEMLRRFGDEDAFTAIGAIGEEQKENEELEHGYSEDELNKLDAAEAERLRQQREMEELERSLAESRRHINSFAYGDNPSSGNRSGNGSRTGTSTATEGYTSQDDFARDLEEIQRRSFERQKAIESGLGIGRFDRDEQAEKLRKDSIAKVRQAEKERNRPKLVIKSGDTNAEKFHTVTSPDDVAEAKLIRAMIDQTTKAKEGTRLRFKLLDDITVSNTKLKKGTYLYGTVTGFGQQRVKATITSILVGDKFINVKLSVFDNDGMEGFYVPESSFREFVKDASSSAVQQNISFESEDGYGSGISGEALALQALQNVYNSASSAISSNIRKNKAKIKYNTIVYLINSEEAR